MDQSWVTQERRSSRSNVMLKATLASRAASWEVVLRNLSQDGALVRAETLPDIGERVLFHRQGLSVPSRVAWVHGEHAGLAFDYPLYPKEVLRHVPAAGAKPPPNFKRPGLAAKPLTAAERELLERWAIESPQSPGD